MTQEFRDNCYDCLRPKRACVCHKLSPLEIKTHFVFLVHPMERQKIKNGTGRMTHLQLKNSTYIFGVDFSENKQINQIIQNKQHQCYLLYPNSHSLNISNEGEKFCDQYDPEKKHFVFVLDGTWPCAKKMLKLSKNLHKMPSISFNNTKKSEFIIKQQPHELCLSTIESTKLVIDELCSLGIEDVSTENFLDPFRYMIEYQVECVKNPHNKRHHHVRRKVIVEKNFYKKETSRSLFYDHTKS